jgi:hypothetical protein
MNAIPTMPSPTTTTFLRCDGGLGYLSASFSSSARAFEGSLLIAMPGEEVAHDIVCWSWLTNVSTGAATTHKKEKPNRIRTVRAARQGKFGRMLFPKSNTAGKESLRGEIVDDDPISRSTASSDRTGLSGPLQLSAKSSKDWESRPLAARTKMSTSQPIVQLLEHIHFQFEGKRAKHIPQDQVRVHTD